MDPSLLVVIVFISLFLICLIIGVLVTYLIPSDEIAVLEPTVPINAEPIKSVAPELNEMTKTDRKEINCDLGNNTILVDSTVGPNQTENIPPIKLKKTWKKKYCRMCEKYRNQFITGVIIGSVVSCGLVALIGIPVLVVASAAYFVCDGNE